MSLRLRLTLWYTSILAVTLLLFGIAFYVFISMKTEAINKEMLERQGKLAVSQIRLIPQWNVFTLPELNDFKSIGVVLQANLTNGTIDKSNNFRGRLPFDPAFSFGKAEKEESWFTTVRQDENNLLIYHIRMESNQQLIGVLQVATEITDNLNFLNNVRTVLTILSLLAVLIAATLGWYLARKVLRPIEHVITAANRIERGTDLGQRIEHIGPNDEIGRLTNTVNGMLARLQATYQELEEAYRAQRRFVSDASHELRTPLTTIRGNVELLEKVWRSEEDKQDMQLTMEAMHDISQEAARMSRLVNDLLALARADAGHQIEHTQVKLKPIIEEVIRKANFLPHQVEWRHGDLQLLENVTVLGSEDYLQQLLFIFIENAFKYTEQGHVQLDILRLGNQVGIRISDTGIGMESEQIPQIFERFYRADTSRGQTSGTGLGLSIAKWIIDEHHGSIEVVSKKNEGSMFIIWLPESYV
ncbi:MAG: HAMP domain-containing sensor histidine kinase [Paenibacillaceae bacterium]